MTQTVTAADGQQATLAPDAPAGLGLFMQGIMSVETSGGHNDPPNGSSAAGYYQFTTGTWANQYGVQHANQATFQQQTTAAAAAMTAYYTHFGNWNEAAQAWFAGPGGVGKNVQDSNGMTPARYGALVTQYMASHNASPVVSIPGLPDSVTAAISNGQQDSLWSYIQSGLNALGLSADGANVTALAAQSKCEGTPNQQGGYNPFNTTFTSTTDGNVQGQKVVPKSTLPNTPGVGNYSSWMDGVLAWAGTITNSTKAALKSGSASAIAGAIAQQGWNGNSATDVGSYQTCINNNIAAFQANPTALANQLLQPINTYGQGPNGAGSSADPGAAVPLGPSLPNVLGGLEGLLGTLTSTAFWKRVGYGLLGAVLLLVGLFLMVNESKEVKNVETETVGAAVAA